MDKSFTHKQLNIAVKQQHHILDQLPALKKLISGAVTLADYTYTLSLLRKCFDATEPLLEQYEIQNRISRKDSYIKKLYAIESDLQALDAKYDKDQEFFNSKVINTIGEYFGVRYVLEGSAQGGIHISRILETTLPEIRDTAFSFWSLQRNTAKQWPEFLNLLAQLDKDKSQRERAIQSAIDTFDIFLNVFNGGTNDKYGT